MIANERATLFFSNFGSCISNMSQFKTYCFFYSFRTIHIIVLPLMDVTEDYMTSNGGLMIELRMSVV